MKEQTRSILWLCLVLTAHGKWPRIQDTPLKLHEWSDKKRNYGHSISCDIVFHCLQVHLTWRASVLERTLSSSCPTRQVRAFRCIESVWVEFTPKSKLLDIVFLIGLYHVGFESRFDLGDGNFIDLPELPGKPSQSILAKSVIITRIQLYLLGRNRPSINRILTISPYLRKCCTLQIHWTVVVLFREEEGVCSSITLFLSPHQHSKLSTLWMVWSMGQLIQQL